MWKVLYVSITVLMAADGAACVQPEPPANPTPTLTPVAAGVLTPTSGTSPTPTATSTPLPIEQIITNEAPELGLAIQDFPVGWQLHEESALDGGHRTYFIKLEGTLGLISPMVVDSWVSVLPQITDAQEWFSAERNARARVFSLDDPGLGDESFRYAGGGKYEVYFRRLNVVARVTMYITNQGSLDDVADWAGKLNAKIDRVKRLGEFLSRVETPTPMPTQASTQTPTTAVTAVSPTETPMPTATATAVSHAGGPLLGRITFATDRDGNLEIYVMDADGANQANLTKNPSNADLHPSWSPLGDKLAYTCRLGGNVGKMAEICVMNADGSNQTPVTNNEVEESFPTWSPDGTKIAFVSSRDGNNEVYVMRADGSGQTNLTNNAAHDEMPAWSPDGRKIAFVSNRNGTWQIFLMNPDGSDQELLTDGPFNSLEPAWSHDGTKIAYRSGRSGNNNIWVMDANGSNQTDITNHPSVEDVPSWSPDDKKIAFRRGTDIYIMDTDGSNPVRLTSNSANDFHPDWGP